MQDIAVQFEKHCWIHSVSLLPPQVHVGRSPLIIKRKIIYKRKEEIKCQYHLIKI
ncbi:hypothetical protein [Spiroplasma endosymbiont of Apeira syringaria]|uniref:hypothetical protein n=1 Tax=Spiroplasma endosymbiont of Apeira syringaria TaxID=3066307 RepID=UPI0030D14737